MAQRKTKAHFKPRGELGEAKASDRKGTMTFSVVGDPFKTLPRPLLRHRQLADGVKARAHCLRLGRLTPRSQSEN